MPERGDEEPRIVDRRSSQASNAGEPSPDTSETPATMDDLIRQLEEEKEKAQSYLASWQRAAADYQNFLLHDFLQCLCNGGVRYSCALEAGDLTQVFPM